LTIIRRRRDPRTVGQRRADERLLARFERGQALSVSRKEMNAAIRRVRRRNVERRQEVARLGMQIAELRRMFGLSQDEIARAIGTSKPNISALERGRAPGISLERFLAVLEALGARPRQRARADAQGGDGAMIFTPTAVIRSVEHSVEAA
jgi:DNA-binding XRE family transcriptional regulator